MWDSCDNLVFSTRLGIIYSHDKLSKIRFEDLNVITVIIVIRDINDIT